MYRPDDAFWPQNEIDTHQKSVGARLQPWSSGRSNHRLLFVLPVAHPVNNSNDLDAVASFVDATTSPSSIETTGSAGATSYWISSDGILFEIFFKIAQILLLNANTKSTKTTTTTETTTDKIKVPEAFESGFSKIGGFPVTGFSNSGNTFCLQLALVVMFAMFMGTNMMKYQSKADLVLVETHLTVLEHCHKGKMLNVTEVLHYRLTHANTTEVMRSLDNSIEPEVFRITSDNFSRDLAMSSVRLSPSVFDINYMIQPALIILLCFLIVLP